jgi:hypothetical protein
MQQGQQQFQGRQQFHLSLRSDDEFEARLAACVKRMPRGYAKLFFARIARLFGRKAKTEEQLLQMMLDFVVDVKPLRLADMPDVRMDETRDGLQAISDVAERYAASEVAEEALRQMKELGHPEEVEEPPRAVPTRDELGADL